MANTLKNFRQGNTKKIRIKYAQDVTGWKFRITLLTEFGKAATTVVETTAGDYVDDSPTEGLTYLVIDSTTSATIPPGKYFYFIERIITGTPDDVLTILPEIKDYKTKIEVVDGAA